MTVKNRPTIFRKLMSYTVAEIHPRFIEIYCLHIQGWTKGKYRGKRFFFDLILDYRVSSQVRFSFFLLFNRVAKTYAVVLRGRVESCVISMNFLMKLREISMKKWIRTSDMNITSKPGQVTWKLLASQKRRWRRLEHTKMDFKEMVSHGVVSVQLSAALG
jgi:hypothetical protein